MANVIYPFTAILGQERLKTALILNLINPRIGGVLITGQKGTAKSTAVRALAAIRGKTEVTKEEVRDSAGLVFLHRTRMLPFETSRKLDMDKINAIIDGE